MTKRKPERNLRAETQELTVKTQFQVKVSTKFECFQHRVK